MYYPKHPNFLQKIDHVHDIMALPCKPTPEIWVQAYFSALPTLIWSLYKPDPLDLGVSRGGRAHKIKKKFVITTYGVERSITPNSITGRKWFMFTTELVNRVGWYMLVADASADLAVNWTSMAYKWSGCKLPGEPWAQSELAEGWPIENGKWHLVHFPVSTDNGRGIYAGPTQTVIDPGVSACFSARVTGAKIKVYPDDYMSGGADIQIRRREDGAVIAQQDFVSDEYNKRSNTLFVKDWFQPGNPGAYEMWVRPLGKGRWGALRDIQFSASGHMVPDTLLPDP